jgi:UDP-N-acetylmuramoyl-L-alanyl-D-glutamate--2,6-diaminopimelate ligase
MLLSQLTASYIDFKQRGADVDVTGITADSRDVKPGYLFIAIPGTQHDGRGFIDEAVKRGAVAVLSVADTKLDGAVLLTTSDIREAVSALAARFYPQQPQVIAAVTGTSGKTSTAQFTREIWQALGYKSGSIGTLGLVTVEERRYGSLTTPDAITLHKMLDECVTKGITHVAMEASSHGLALHRLDNVRIASAGFTNLSHDHLDYHMTMENYFAAKLRLFSEVMKPGAAAILNADIAQYERLSETISNRGLKVISYGKNARDIKLIESVPETKGQRMRFDMFGKRHDILLPLIGEFQAWNSLCALGMTVAAGADIDQAVAALGSITGVPGRLQLAGYGKNGGAVFVDYAHKPDAMENVLKALRPHVAAHPGAKLGVIFGCGGNRDKIKRPIMGDIAARLADWVIVTDDNPRHEQAAVIRQEILAGWKSGAPLKEIGDRSKAIETGIAQLGKGDVLIIAGKGHESGQIIGDRTMPFDDAEVARKVLGL